MMTDPISDMLTRIRNAGSARHVETRCPSSRLKKSVAQVLSEEGFISGFRVEDEDGPKPTLVLELRYAEGGNLMIDSIQRISKPGRRIYVGAGEVPQVRSGLGIAIMSTSQGVMTDRAARAAGIGGEVMCEVW